MKKRGGLSRRQFFAAIGVGLSVLGGLFAYRRLWRSSAPSVKLTVSPGDLSSLDTEEPFDVCIIGSGPAGMVTAADLVKRGVRTLVVESGSDLTAKADPRRKELDRFQNSGTIDYPIATSRVRAVGGTTTIWTGRCSRLHPLDLQANSYTPADSGWPITYDDLKSYYLRAEKTLRVRGGPLSAYRAPRQEPLPLPPNLDIAALKSLMQRVGVTVDDSPTATGLRGESSFQVGRDLVPQFIDSRNGVFLSGATVTRLLPDRSGRITGAEVRNLDRSERLIKARAFVVACGGLESIRLLNLSLPPGSDIAIGNRYDRLGRGFMEHPNIMFSGRVQHSLATISPAYELGRSHQFYEEFKQMGFGSVLLVFTQSWIFRDDLSKWDLEAIRRKFGRLRLAELRIGATVEMQPSDSNRLTLSPTIRDYFGNPVSNLALGFSDGDRQTLQQAKALIRRIYQDLEATDVTEMAMTWSHHHMGGCPMGDSPTASIVDRDLKLYDSPNLYVVGSSPFITAGAAHPTLTIVALSHRLADHLLQRLERGELGQHASRDSDGRLRLV